MKFIPTLFFYQCGFKYVTTPSIKGLMFDIKQRRRRCTFITPNTERSATTEGIGGKRPETSIRPRRVSHKKDDIAVVQPLSGLRVRNHALTPGAFARKFATVLGVR